MNTYDHDIYSEMTHTLSYSDDSDLLSSAAIPFTTTPTTSSAEATFVSKLGGVVRLAVRVTNNTEKYNDITVKIYNSDTNKLLDTIEEQLNPSTTSTVAKLVTIGAYYNYKISISSSKSATFSSVSVTSSVVPKLSYFIN